MWVRSGGMGQLPDAVGVHTRGMLSVGEQAEGVRAFSEPMTEKSELVSDEAGWIIATILQQ